ncbi:hypothetical protein PHYPSEUDO_006444 [Phytophthora pseudosyringae]|uniref:Uncharacterized protein n=1 Tax=Phytophthora pseudosyringae TaxID=221518 RepID=A0A8T1VLP5_9STRA|nr:hypothetical protein PHYPSEUDO_006444 [Phytophthora pseudosyringae]
MILFKDLLNAGIRPPVLILKWKKSGNHFKAVTYPPEQHAYYAKNIVALAVVRNDILRKHGWKPMDTTPYDAEKTEEAATSTLEELSAAVQQLEQLAQQPHGESVPKVGESENLTPTQKVTTKVTPQTIKHEVDELMCAKRDSDRQESISGDQESVKGNRATTKSKERSTTTSSDETASDHGDVSKPKRDSGGC